MTPISCKEYAENLSDILDKSDWTQVEGLAEKLTQVALSGNSLFICGNGGSAGNAMHLANDFLYGVNPSAKPSLKVEALPSNSAVITCLGNDIGYDNIFSHQLKVKASEGDLLLVLSGSGNSRNIINAIDVAKANGVYTAGILGYSGGEALSMLDCPVHFPVNDMQISEDLQLVVGHMLMRLLNTSLSSISK